MSVIRRLGLSRNNGIQVGLASTYIGGLDDIWADDINFNLSLRRQHPLLTFNHAYQRYNSTIYINKYLTSRVESCIIVL
jgi:hypothetical protein